MIRNFKKGLTEAQRLHKGGAYLDHDFRLREAGANMIELFTAGAREERQSAAYDRILDLGVTVMGAI